MSEGKKLEILDILRSYEVALIYDVSAFLIRHFYQNDLKGKKRPSFKTDIFGKTNNYFSNKKAGHVKRLRDQEVGL